MKKLSYCLLSFSTLFFLAALTGLLNTAYAQVLGWQNNGSDIYYNEGNVGIGTSSPTANLDVVTTGNSNNVTFTKSGAGAQELLMTSTDSANQGIKLEKNDTDYLRISNEWNRYDIYAAGANKPIDLIATGNSGGINLYKSGSGGTNNVTMAGQTGGSTNQRLTMSFATGDDFYLYHNWSGIQMNSTQAKTTTLGTGGQIQIKMNADGSVCIGKFS